jgi:protein-disulfide isomerase
VEADFNSGVRSGVRGTPTFFVDGVRYEGDTTVEGLLAALDRTDDRVR